MQRFELQYLHLLCGLRRAFYTVLHQKLLDVLIKAQIDDKGRRIIQNLYWHQSATIRTNLGYEPTKAIQILRTLLFNVYSEEIFSETLENCEHGICTSKKNYQQLMKRVNEVSDLD